MTGPKKLLIFFCSGFDLKRPENVLAITFLFCYNNNSHLTPRYQVTPDMSWNGTEIMARIVPKENSTAYHQKVIERVEPDRKTMLVMDSKYSHLQ